jgi:hydrogenase maturation protease
VLHHAPQHPADGSDEDVPAAAPLLIIGVGNYLMGDEGVGVHILHALERLAVPSGVRLLDGGTGGVNLLPEMEGARHVIMLDATRDGQPAGTITRLRPTCPAEVPRGLSAHDFGVKDLFAAAALLGAFPPVTLYTISIEMVNPMTMTLSEPVAASMPDVIAEVWRLTDELLAVLQSSRG